MTGISLNLVVMRSADLAKPVAFYRTLGLSFTAERHGNGPEHFACDLGETVLEIYPASEVGSIAAVRLGFRVPSVECAMSDLARIGVTVLRQPYLSPGGRRAVVADPDGHRVELSDA